jgi:PIN domain
VDDFESLQGELSLIGIDAQLAHEAGRLAEEFALRGYDAVHLASALSVGKAITLVSWDQDLRRAAADNGCALAPSAPPGSHEASAGPGHLGSDSSPRSVFSVAWPCSGGRR